VIESSELARFANGLWLAEVNAIVGSSDEGETSPHLTKFSRKITIRYSKILESLAIATTGYVEGKVDRIDPKLVQQFIWTTVALTEDDRQAGESNRAYLASTAMAIGRYDSELGNFFLQRARKDLSAGNASVYFPALLLLQPDSFLLEFRDFQEKNPKHFLSTRYNEILFPFIGLRTEELWDFAFCLQFNRDFQLKYQSK